MRSYRRNVIIPVLALLVVIVASQSTAMAGGGRGRKPPPTTTTTTAPPTTTTTTTASPSTASPTGGTSCLDGGIDVVVSGLQALRYRNTSVAAGATIDARTASWLAVGDWPVHLDGGAGACWSGGTIEGTFSDDTTWATLHGTGAFNALLPGLTVEDLRVHNYGDGIRMIEGSPDFTVRGAELSFVRDDCIENDYLYSGLVEDSLLDGCYVAFSARTYSGQAGVSGAANTWRIQGNLVRLQPMPTVYSGPAPGHGGFFKWDRDPSIALGLSLHDNIFRVDQDANHTGLGVPPELTDCSNNVVVWLGAGPYPDPLPSCFTVTTDRRVWDDAVAAWHVAHP